MGQMTDPLIALKSFQEVHALGGFDLAPGQLDPTVFGYVDQPNGEMRLTYVRLDGKRVTAFVTFVLADPIDDEICFNVGYAVPEELRGEGRAKSLLESAIREMQHGFGLAGMSAFHVEAIIDVDNLPSQRLAQRVISQSPASITDQVSSLPAMQYVRRVVTVQGV